MRHRPAKNRSTKYKSISVFLAAIVLILSSLLGLILFRYIQERKRERTEPIILQISMTEEAAARACIWLSQIDDMPFSYEDIKGYIGDLSVEVVLTPTETAGVYEQSLSEDTYIECKNRAEKVLKETYMYTLRHRLEGEGFDGEITDEVLDRLMRKAYGISVDEYLTRCDIQLLPKLQDLKEEYSGEVVYEKH